MRQKIDELPLLPVVFMKVIQLSPEAEDYFEQIETLIKEDPGLAVRVVALANSGASAPATPIVAIEHALARIGAAAIRRLAAALSVQRVFMPTKANEVAMWLHSIDTAVAAQHLARLAPRLGVEEGEAYLAGLLHDIGRFVMFEHAPEELLAVDEQHWENPDQLIAADLEVFKYTHSELGSLACQRWGLPQRLSEVVRLHHEPIDGALEEGSMAAVTYCVQFGDQLSLNVLSKSEADDFDLPEGNEELLELCYPAAIRREEVDVSRVIAEMPKIIAEASVSKQQLGLA